MSRRRDPARERKYFNPRALPPPPPVAVAPVPPADEVAAVEVELTRARSDPRWSTDPEAVTRRMIALAADAHAAGRTRLARVMTRAAAEVGGPELVELDATLRALARVHL